MSIENLEKKFAAFTDQYPERIEMLADTAAAVADIQVAMRDLLDGITEGVCGDCSAPCCQCMPVEGWFTESDYFVFRMLHEAPFKLIQDHGIDNGCAFLGRCGCVLPRNARPFPCVKVNCALVNEALKQNRTHADFSRLSARLLESQTKLWKLISP